MKQVIQHLIHTALAGLAGNDALKCDIPDQINIDRARDKSHGDFASNIAMVLAKPAGMNPRQLAEMIVTALPADPAVAKVEIAGPGFINFTLAEDALNAVVKTVLEQADDYGRGRLGAGQRIQIEFVSANPTGPLHVGHGRGAAYGASLANLLRAAGYDVHNEYYVNDAGRQMNILAASVWLRYLELGDAAFEARFPANGYQGDYVRDISTILRSEYADRFEHSVERVFADLPADEGEPDGDKERHIDALIERGRALLGEEDYMLIFDAGLKRITADIRDDLAEFGVLYDDWYSERQLHTSGRIDECIERLQKSGHVYADNGALWFRSTDYGDEKDRVVVRDNGVKTYFAADIAYHMEKLERGFDRVIDIWGADHHGYVPRVKAALAAIGDDPSRLDVLLVQFAVLYRGGEKVPMSTRSGQFVTLRELRHEVGNDAARFFYVLRKCEQHMDFDLDLAKSQSNENPVYYVQYAHARICSVYRQLAEKNLTWDSANGLARLDRLSESHETDLMTALTRYPELIEAAARNHEPHQIAYYVREVATAFHTYYNAHQFIVDDADLRDARLALITATRQVLKNGLQLLGVTAPDTM
ncbi:arginine--tRNA ligase [Sulfuriflexus sp.]|uniref:arginine--tRNA ligase n=1 Tax=Sulfuriflexus sp. TaxID=2015443 RepID=UPI0028CDBE7D|nr:arginine--tRNA ligase [Sulfuriflexus sp.]MDT8403168.1 arginine--tRNA ligase [Sulfuriflexus sp.]